MADAASKSVLFLTSFLSTWQTALAPSSSGAAAAAAAAGGGAVLATEDAGREVGRGGGERSGTDASGGGRCARFGKRLVNIVRMDARFGSLETVGSLVRSATQRAASPKRCARWRVGVDSSG
eukprot:492326-Rhodomonas_salina.4